MLNMRETVQRRKKKLWVIKSNIQQIALIACITRYLFVLTCSSWMHILTNSLIFSHAFARRVCMFTVLLLKNLPIIMFQVFHFLLLKVAHNERYKLQKFFYSTSFFVRSHLSSFCAHAYCHQFKSKCNFPFLIILFIKICSRASHAHLLYVHWPFRESPSIVLSKTSPNAWDKFTFLGELRELMRNVCVCISRCI